MKNQNRVHKRRISNIPAKTSSQRILFALLAIGIFLSGCSGLLSKKVDPLASVPIKPTFEQHEIDTGSAKYQTVLTGFLLGNATAEVAVVSSDESDKRQLHIYTLSNSTWVPRLDVTLRPEVLFVDVANIGGRDRLLIYEHGHLNWFDPESEMECAMVEITTNYNATGQE